MARRRPIYVESLVRAPMDALWAATQEPGQHQRWDLRFGTIEYLARVDGEPQRFTYATTVAPGVTIAGTGESLGDRDRADGSRWSGLRFWAEDRRSLIGAGAGYWRYLPTDDGIRFLTRYDYRPRWGHVGAALDRFVFRPLFGWATAWSFDRLRIWLEDGVTPERTRNLAMAHVAATAGAVAGGGFLLCRIRGRRSTARPGWLMAAFGVAMVATTRGRPSGRRPLRAAPDRQPDVGDLP